MATVAQAFLFNADAEGVSGYYGGDFEPPFLRALSTVDPIGITRSTAFLGDVIVHSLCERVTAVSHMPRRSSLTMGHDPDLYRLIIWDLADAFSGQWHTLDLESFPVILGRQNVYSITMGCLPIQFREGVDADLRETKGYLGSVEIDLGNPIQKTLLLDQLIDVAVIAEGCVTLELSWEGTPESGFAGADRFLPRGERRVAYGELDGLKPPIPEPSEFSERGRIYAGRYNGKRKYTIHERVLRALSALRPQNGEPSEFSFGGLLAANAQPIEAELPEAKFVRYLLNPEHPTGRKKAKFFNDVLGIGAEDWRYLAAQFYAGLKKADFAKLKVKAWKDGYGASFNCIMPVLGLNGRVAMVETNWILKPGLLPQLSTAYPAERDDDADVDDERIAIVPSTLSGDAKWEALYAVAHKAGSLAAEKCVPTPMKIVGGEVILERACGSAHVRVPDARKGFARWVIRSGRGYNHYRSGASIYARVNSQSVDRAVAYAQAFAAVLHFNGIECSVQSRLD